MSESQLAEEVLLTALLCRERHRWCQKTPLLLTVGGQQHPMRLIGTVPCGCTLQL